MVHISQVQWVSGGMALLAVTLIGASVLMGKKMGAIFRVLVPGRGSDPRPDPIMLGLTCLLLFHQ